MKNILTMLGLSIVALAQPAMAQTFKTLRSANGDSAKVNGTGTIHVDIGLRSNGAPVTLKWNVLDYSTNLGASGTQWTLDGICDNNLCYVGAPLLAGQNYTTSPYDSTTFGTFYALLNSDNAPSGSSAWVRALVRDANPGGGSRTATFIATKNSTGITQSAVLGDGLQLYPNPSKATLFVSLPDNSKAKSLSIVSTDGKQVLAQQVTDKVLEVPVAQLAAGIYFIRLKDENGNTIATRKFQHD